MVTPPGGKALAENGIVILTISAMTHFFFLLQVELFKRECLKQSPKGQGPLHKSKIGFLTARSISKMPRDDIHLGK